MDRVRHRQLHRVQVPFYPVGVSDCNIRWFPGSSDPISWSSMSALAPSIIAILRALLDYDHCRIGFDSPYGRKRPST